MMRLTLFVFAAAAFAGCNSAQVAQPLTNDLAESETAFWHELSNRPVVSNDEAFHAILLMANDEDAADNYAARVAAMKAGGLLAADFDEPANQAVKRGDVAIATCKLLNIKGGAIMRAFGPSRRYAHAGTDLQRCLPRQQ